MPLRVLTQLPPEVRATLDLLDRFTAGFAAGLGRLGDQGKERLSFVGRVFAGTPLAERAARLGEDLGRGQLTADTMVTAAALHGALYGACTDALLAQAGKAIEREIAFAPIEWAAGPTDASPLMESTRQWLLELALAGFGQLDAATVMPFVPTLEEIQGQPELKELAALLTGFLDQLLEAVPTANLDELPLVHWVDLWCRAVLRSYRGLPRPSATEVSGALLVLGLDLRQHEHLTSLVAHGLLDSKYVRTTVSAWKVDAVAKGEIWKTLQRPASNLLAAVVKQTSLRIDNMPLSSTGDLLWNDQAKVGKKKAKVLATAAKNFGADATGPLTLPAVPPLCRHPVQLAIPLHLAAPRFAGGQITIGDATLRLATERLGSEAGLDQETLDNAREVFGLIRFDGGAWAYQPLLASDGKKLLGPNQNIAAGLKGKSSALGVLQERASHLLRNC